MRVYTENHLLSSTPSNNLLKLRRKTNNFTDELQKNVSGRLLKSYSWNFYKNSISNPSKYQKLWIVYKVVKANSRPLQNLVIFCHFSKLSRSLRSWFLIMAILQTFFKSFKIHTRLLQKKAQRFQLEKTTAFRKPCPIEKQTIGCKTLWSTSQRNCMFNYYE